MNRRSSLFILFFCTLTLVSLWLFWPTKGEQPTLKVNVSSPTVSSLREPSSQIKKTTAAEEVSMEAKLKRLLEIQAQYDKDHGKFISQLDSNEKFFEFLRSLRFLQTSEEAYYLIEKPETQEDLAHALAQFRYSTDPEEKLELLKKITDFLYTSERYHPSTQYLECLGNDIKTKKDVTEMEGTLFFEALDDPEGDLTMSSYSFSNPEELKEWFEDIKSQVKDHAVSYRKSVRGIIYVRNWERELQYCEYRYEPSPEQIKALTYQEVILTDSGYLSAKTNEEKARILDQALNQAMREFQTRLDASSTPRYSREGAIIYQEQYQKAKVKRDELYRYESPFKDLFSPK